MQYFCGYPGYNDEKLPFDPSLMVYFRKRLTPEILGEINEMIVQDAKARQGKGTAPQSDDDDDYSDGGSGTGGNSGTMIMDATCAPANIRYPQDVSLLNEARENAEKLLDVLHDSSDGKKPRTYRKRARKDYLKYARCRKHTAKMTRKAIGKQLGYLRRDLSAIEHKLSLGKTLTARQTERLNTIRTIYEQQKYMYDHRTHSVPDRIVSVSQPFVRPIVRGKAGKPVEFGAKLDISVVDGWTRLEYCSFDAYNEAGNLKMMVERFREREGHYPSRILADKIYRNRENLSFCKEHGIRYEEHEEFNEEVISQADILYMTRVQRERFTDLMEYERVKDVYVLKAQMLEQARPNMRILHPLPRVNEIAYDVDDDPHAYYFEQAKNGLYAREAIICDCLGITLDEVRADQTILK